MIHSPAGYRVRPASRDDIDALVGLAQAVDRRDDGIVEPVRGHIEGDRADHRGHGLGTWLLRWTEARARRYPREPGHLDAAPPGPVLGRRRRSVLEGLGYRLARTLWQAPRAILALLREADRRGLGCPA